MGIEPTFEAWEAPVLPLNYTRRLVDVDEFTTDGGQESPTDSNGMAPENGEMSALVTEPGRH